MRGQAAFYDQPFLSFVFLESNVLFFGQNKYTNTRRFWTIFCHKGLSAFKKYKKYSLEYNNYKVYLTKAKINTLSIFTENAQSRTCPK